MSDITTYTFTAEAPIGLSVNQRSGDVVVTASDTTDVVVELQPSGPNGEELAERTRVEYRPGALRIDVPRTTSVSGRSSSVHITVTVPTDSTVDLQTGSGEVRLDGRFGAVSGKSGSGDVSIDSCADVRLAAGSGDVFVHECADAVVRTGSGDIRLGDATGTVDLESGSGAIEVEHSVRQGRLSAASGDLSIGTVAGRVELRTASGDITARRAVEGEIRAKSTSGDISVGIVKGTAANLDVASISGSIRSELDQTDAPAETDRTLLLNAHTVSGGIWLHRTA